MASDIIDSTSSAAQLGGSSTSWPPRTPLYDNHIGFSFAAQSITEAVGAVVAPWFGMKVMTQLAFNGNCRQAFEQYAHVLRGEITVMNTHGGNTDKELPPGSTATAPALVRFAELQIGEEALLGNDVPPDEYAPMRGFSVALHMHDPAEARRVFDGLAEGGKVTAPLTELSWAKLWGMVTDRFGVPWLVLALRD